MPTQRTCLFITDYADDNLAVFAYIYVKHELEFLEVLSKINDMLHKHHDKIYYYPNVTKETALTIIKNYAEDYDCFTVTIRGGISK